MRIKKYKYPQFVMLNLLPYCSFVRLNNLLGGEVQQVFYSQLTITCIQLSINNNFKEYSLNNSGNIYGLKKRIFAASR